MHWKRILPATVLVAVSLLACSKETNVRHVDRVFLIAADFMGPVVILYDDPNGQPAASKDRDGRQVLRIPTDGILRLREQARDGVIGTVEFYRESAANGISLPHGQEVPRDEPQVFMETTGVVPGPPIRTRLDSGVIGDLTSTDGIGARKYESFVVGIPSSRPNVDWFRAREKLIERAIR